MKIFHLYDYYDYKFKLGRQRIGYMDIIGEYDGVTLYRSGTRWPNWNPNLTLYNNIYNICDGEPDIIVGYIHKFTPLDIVEQFSQLKIKRVLTYCELRSERYNLLQQLKPDIITCAYPHEIKTEIVPEAKWFCLPHAVASSVFCNFIPFAKRDIDISIYGTINVRTYPLRSVMLEAVCALSDKYKCYVHPHNGKIFPYADSGQHLADLAYMLNRSKITCTCTSLFKYRVNKFSEIPSCGSVILSDMPIVDRDEQSLREYMLEVDDNISVSQLIDIISNALSDQQTLYNKHLLGIQYAKNYTTHQYAKQLMDILNG